MKYSIVYAVMCDGEVAYASTNREDAREYVEDKGYKARKEILERNDVDDPEVGDIAYADFIAGYEEYYEIEIIDITNKAEDDIIELSDGGEIEVSEILDKLKQTKRNSYF